MNSELNIMITGIRDLLNDYLATQTHEDAPEAVLTPLDNTEVALEPLEAPEATQKRKHKPYKRYRWTDERVIILINFVRDGNTLKQIVGKSNSFTEAAIRKKLYLLGFRVHKNKIMTASQKEAL